MGASLPAPGDRCPPGADPHAGLGGVLTFDIPGMGPRMPSVIV